VKISGKNILWGVQTMTETCQEIQTYEPSRQIVVREQPGLVPTVHELQVYQTIAEQAEASKFYQGLGGRAGIVSIMLYARELNVPPMLAISGGIHNIQGKIEMSARLINSKIRESGHSMKIIALDEKVCRLWGKRKDTAEELEVSYSLEQAKKAGLVRDGSNWVKNPEDMLFSRAISRLGRRLFPDVIGTAYVEGEVREAIESAPPGPRNKPKPLPQPKLTKTQPPTEQPPQGEVIDVPPEEPPAPEQAQEKIFPEETPQEAPPAEQPSTGGSFNPDDLNNPEIMKAMPCKSAHAFLKAIKIDGKNLDEAQILLGFGELCKHFATDMTGLAEIPTSDVLAKCRDKAFQSSLMD
jgi:hypothetical protein